MFKIIYGVNSEGTLTKSWRKYIQEVCVDTVQTQGNISIDEFLDIVIECIGGIDTDRTNNAITIAISWYEVTIRVVAITNTDAIIELIF